MKLSCGVTSFPLRFRSFFLLISLSIFSIFSQQAYARPPVQQLILLSIRKNWKSPTPFFSSWVKGRDCSLWNGVQCDANGNVVQVDVNSNQIRGRIPTTICKLTTLKGLYLNDNLFSGPIPGCIGNLVNLQKLLFGGNRLTGRTPLSICKLKKLLALYLNDNYLSQAIPSCIGNLSLLDELYLNNLKISGRIPASICKLTKVSFFSLANNKLSGTIPTCFGNLNNLFFADLSGNQLVGRIPNSLCAWKSIYSFKVYSNYLSGPIPSCFNLKNLKSLSIFQVNNNYFTGDLNLSCNLFFKCDVSTNCLSGVSKQRTNAQCARFCKANNPAGPCGGYGTCYLNSKKTPFCKCPTGRAPPNCRAIR